MAKIEAKAGKAGKVMRMMIVRSASANRPVFSAIRKGLRSGNAGVQNAVIVQSPCKPPKPQLWVTTLLSLCVSGDAYYNQTQLSDRYQWNIGPIEGELVLGLYLHQLYLWKSKEVHLASGIHWAGQAGDLQELWEMYFMWKEHTTRYPNHGWGTRGQGFSPSIASDSRYMTAPIRVVEVKDDLPPLHSRLEDSFGFMWMLEDCVASRGMYEERGSHTYHCIRFQLIRPIQTHSIGRSHWERKCS